MRGYRLPESKQGHRRRFNSTIRSAYMRAIDAGDAAASTHSRPRTPIACRPAVSSISCCNAARNADGSSGATLIPACAASRIRGISVPGSIAANTGRPAARVEYVFDEQLAAAGVRHLVLGAEGIEQLLAAHAQGRAQAARRIVDAGVDHLAVAGAGLRADQLVLLQHHHLMAGDRQRPGDGQAHRAGADDDGFDVRGHGLLPCACACSSERNLWRTIDRKIQY